MKRFILGAGFLALAWGSAPAWSLGLFDGELGVDWWNTQFDFDTEEGNYDAGSLSAHAGGWWDLDWGVMGNYYRADLEDQDISNQSRYNLNLKRRLFSPTDNTYIAAGLGWEHMDLVNGDNSNGARLSLEGSAGLLGFMSLYAQATWLPWLSDASTFTGLSGNEWEVGLKFEPAPFLTLSGGYRRFRLDYDEEAFSEPGSSTADGVFLGLGVHW